MSDAGTVSAADRAAAALARTDQLSVPVEAETYTGIRGPELDAVIAELEELLADLAGPAESGATAAAVAARLGRCRAVRFVLHGAPADRERALPLLDQARTSALLGAQEREAAYRGLVALAGFRLMRLARDSSVLTAPHWTVDRLVSLSELGTPLAQGGSGIVEDSALLVRLLLEREQQRMTPELRGRLEAFGGLTDALLTDDTGAFVREARPLLDAMTDGSLPASTSTLLTLMLGEMERSLATSPAPPGTPGDGPAEDTDAAVVTRDALTEFLALAEVMSPGIVGPQNVSGLLAELIGEPSAAGREDGRAPMPSRMIGALVHCAQALYTGDLEGFREALRLIHEAWAGGEFDGTVHREWLPAILPVLFLGASLNGGSLVDEELARDLFEAQEWDGDPTGVHSANLRLCGETMRLQARLTSALDRGDTAAVEDVIDALCELELDAAYAAAEEWPGTLVGFVLGTAYLGLVVMDGAGDDRTAHLRAAAHHMQRALEASVEMPVLRSLLDIAWAPLLTLTAITESDPARIAEGVRRARTALANTEFTGVLRPRSHGAIAYALDTLHLLTGDAGALDEAIGELTVGLEGMPEGLPGGAGVTWDLAALHAKRAGLRAGAPGAGEDLSAAVGLARTSLRHSADEVLLQQGVGRGLRIARAAADRGRAAAFWALRAGRAEEAIACLEAGRSLVLGAAAVSAGVADRLAALGESELAERWRAAADQDRGDDRSLWELSADVASGGPAGGSPMEVLAAVGTGAPGLPGDLRRRSLELLRGRGGAELEPVLPAADDLRAGLRVTGADALLYLVPGVDERDGAVLVVPRDGPAVALPLPVLTPEGRGPVAAYLAAGADRQRLETAAGATEECAERRWLRALDDLCAWAGEVLAPALDHLDLWPHALTESGLRSTSAGGADVSPASVVGADARAALDGDTGVGSASVADSDALSPLAGDTDVCPASAGGADVCSASAGRVEASPAPAGSAGVCSGPVERAGVGPGPDAGDGMCPVTDAGAGVGGAVRLVLVPCGELGVVPWQAALLRPSAGLGVPRPVRACEVAVLTHAASGREFLRAAARRRMPLAGRPALVFHGGDDLEWAEEEIDTLAAVHYPGAVVHRPHEDPATPETVLALLGGRAAAPASLVHLACHGLAGPDPTRSALLLADPERADEPTRTAGLTLSTLLETPAEGDAFRSAGPLVVCGGCETDLTTRDHDEALTVTSVMVHRLAADAIGSRWKVDDKRSELIMLVLHDALNRGLAPPDALRAAQRWMLTAPHERPLVPALEDISATRLAEDFRERPDTWAAFVHHGNPAPAAPAARQREGETV
ncbi:CHAT domain-containing protein [Streptomyces sp. NPDC006658]|uniref:CHAT domain-containing protein n=1 Tax=Streptomyces sp. NPDC006658 TaxID=3156900 RepID=UPI0033E35AEA